MTTSPFGLDGYSNLAVILFAEKTDDFAIFKQQQLIQERLRVVGGGTVFFS